ncbi:MAG TPA: sulfate ABC transporter permease subunit CysT, partial [Mycobacteriales bacterium]
DRTGLGVLTGEPTDPADNAGPADHAGAVPAHRPRTGPVRGALGPGVVLLYLSVMVVLPIAALTGRASTSDFWVAVTSPQATSALSLTIGMALATAAIDVVAGVLVAWVLVRDEFAGKRLVNAVIDLPFALPTIVAGLVLLTLYGPDSPIGVNVAQTRAAVLLALLFVTLPFVVRAVQPVLLVADRDVEDAAASLGASPMVTFFRLTVPAILPAALTGGGLAFARALGEFGAVVLISGNLPFHTQVASVFIAGQVESGATGDAAAISVTLLAIALAVLATLNWAARRGGRRG